MTEHRSNTKIVDLRSDTVTCPTPAMRKVMADAQVGDDVYGEDPTVNRLEAMSAERLGHEAALFAPTGTQTNLLGILSHCERGDEYIVGQMAHTYRSEGGGAAVLGSVQPQPLDFEPDGTLDLGKVAKAIKPDNFHFARTRLLCLENTQGGKVLPLEYLRAARGLASEHGLGLHLDGARVFNAAVKLGVPPDTIGREFDSVSFCLSKGLGAPVGSMLTGSRDLIDRARRWRKVVGGGMRQAGIIAAAGVYVLEHHVDRLAEDHENAAMLAEGLAAIDGVDVDPGAVQTNMVMIRIDPAMQPGLLAYLSERNVIMRGGDQIRLVTHLDMNADGIRHVVDSVREYFENRGG